MNNKLAGVPYQSATVNKNKKHLIMIYLVPIIIGLIIGAFIINQKTAKAKKSLANNTVANIENTVEKPKKTNKKTVEPIIAAALEQEVRRNANQADTNASIGKSIINAGQKEVKICSQDLSPDCQVYLSAEDETEGAVLFVKRKVPFNPETEECSHFVAGLSRSLETDISFSWWIIN